MSSQPLLMIILITIMVIILLIIIMIGDYVNYNHHDNDCYVNYNHYEIRIVTFMLITMMMMRIITFDHQL